MKYSELELEAKTQALNVYPIRLFSDASHFSICIEFELSSDSEWWGQCHNASVSTEGIYKV